MTWPTVHGAQHTHTHPRLQLLYKVVKFARNGDNWQICLAAFRIPSFTKSLQLQIGNKIENNRTVSDYRRYNFILNRKQYVRALGRSWLLFEVHISKHSSFRLKITVGCLTSAYPSIHFSLDEGHSQDHGRLPDKCISKRSQNSQDHGRLPEVLWCVVCGVWCGCMRVLCCVMSCVLCCLV